MRDDVIKLPLRLAGISSKLHQVHCPQFDILQSHLRHDAPTILDLPARQIDPHEPAARKAHRHRDQVHPVCAADLKHPARFDIRRRHTSEHSHHRQPIRMRLAVHEFLIRKLVVIG